jgi:hypothetical protein
MSMSREWVRSDGTGLVSVKAGWYKVNLTFSSCFLASSPAM